LRDVEGRFQGLMLGDGRASGYPSVRCSLLRWRVLVLLDRSGFRRDMPRGDVSQKHCLTLDNTHNCLYVPVTFEKTGFFGGSPETAQSLENCLRSREEGTHLSRTLSVAFTPAVCLFLHETPRTIENFNFNQGCALPITKRFLCMRRDWRANKRKRDDKS
jgi:hypothetical protein